MKRFSILLMVTMISMFYGMPGAWASRSWLEDWVYSKTTTTSGNYYGQSRGYFTAGSFSARWPMSNEQLIDFQPPRIASGCGGIDLFGGGLSFLDSDRLVQKFQSVIQAAPAVAFDMALKTVCKECSDTMRNLEMMVNDLNGLVQSDCQMAKALAEKAMPTVPEDNALNTVAARINQNLGRVRDYYEQESNTVAANGNPGVDLRLATDSCSNAFKAIFAEGSLIQRIADDLAFSDYADLLRGLMGDVVIQFDASSSTYDMDIVLPCRANRSTSLEDFITGSVQERSVGGTCRDNASTNFRSYIDNQVQSIAAKISQGAPALTPAEIAFIDSAPLPVEKTLRWGAMTDNMDGAKSTLRDPLAVAYAYYAIDDLYRSVQYLMQHAQAAAQKPLSAGGDPNLCNPLVFATAITQVTAWSETIRQLRQESKSSYHAEIQRLADYQTLMKTIMENYRLAEQKSLRELER